MSSWFSTVVGSFASGAAGAFAKSALQSNSPQNDDTVTKADSAFRPMCSTTKNGSDDLDAVLEETMNGNYGKAWKTWCDATQSDQDPVSGQSREESGSDVNTMDRN